MNRVIAFALLGGMATLFGASFVATKHALSSFSPVQLIFLRFLLATTVFLLLRPWLPETKLDRRGYATILALAAIEPGAYFFLEASGVKRTLASTASILISTIPVFVLIIETVFLRVRVVAREVALIALSLAGVALVLVAEDLRHALGGSMQGNLLVLAAAIAASIYTALARDVIVRYSPLAVTRVQSLFATVLYAPFAGISLLMGDRPRVTFSSAAALVYLAVGCSFLGYFLLNTALSRIKASIVGAWSNLIPVVATALAVALLGEKLRLLQVVGGVIVVTSVALLTMRQRGRGTVTTIAIENRAESDAALPSPTEPSC